MNKTPADFIETFNDFVLSIIRLFGGDWLYLSDEQAEIKNKNKMKKSLQIELEFEKHNYFEICLCVNGKLVIEFDDKIQHLKKGDICIIFPNINHREDPYITGGHETIWVLVSMDTITLMLTGKKDNESLSVDWAFALHETAEKYSVSKMLQMIHEEFKNDSDHSKDYSKAIVLQILIILLRDVGDLIQKETPKKYWKEEIVEEVKNYIESNYSQNFKLNDIAQLLSFSPNYLNTIFKGITGFTIIKYTEQLRIYKANWLLKETDYSVSCIASMLGYCDQYHFSKNFKKEMGQSPTEFRKS